MKKYIVFGGSHFYPKGGMWDCLGYSDTVEESKKMAEEFLQWGQIVEVDSLTIKYAGRKDYQYARGDGKWEWKEINE